MAGEPTDAVNTPAGGTPPRSRPLFAALAFLLALAALALSAYQYALRGELDARGAVSALDARVASLNRENENLQTVLASLNAKLDALSAELASLRGGVDALQARGERDNTDFALAEIEYLLVIATQRLTLSRDPATALAALEAADRRLAGFDGAAITGLRAQLAADMNALRAVPEVDVPGLSLFLADLVQRAESLPIRDEYLRRREAGADQPAAPESARGWRGFWQGIWNEISRHLVITRSDQGAKVMLLPEEKFFLVHNLRLQLETARLAALRSDTDSFKASIGLAVNWIDTYYDTGNTAVANVQETLRRMGSLKLDPDLPDINSSLESTRALIRERSAAGNGEAVE